MIADRTYHRLLHLDWIRADIDGDGLREYVPHVDRIGPQPPKSTYELFAAGTPTMEPSTTKRFYLGGNICEGWSAVPEEYKAPDFSKPDPSPPMVKIFTFRF